MYFFISRQHNIILTARKKLGILISEYSLNASLFLISYLFSIKYHDVIWGDLMFREVETIVWVVILIIGLIIGMIFGFIGPNLLHLILFKQGGTFLIQTPFISNILMFVAVGLFVLFCIGMMLKNKIWNFIGLLFLIISIIVSSYANLGYYTLFTDDGITIKNHMNKEIYRWDEITEAVDISPYNEAYKLIQLTFDNSKRETFKINRTNGAEFSKIRQKLSQNDIELKYEMGVSIIEN